MILLILAEVLADTVKHHDRVVYGKAQDRKKRRHKERVDLEIKEKIPEERENPRWNDHVMRQCNDRNQPVFPRRHRLGYPAKRKRDKENNGNHDDSDRDNRLALQFVADHGTDGGETLFFKHRRATERKRI